MAQIGANGMHFARRQVFALAMHAAALAGMSHRARAQSWPARPVRIVVGYPAGIYRGFYLKAFAPDELILLGIISLGAPLIFAAFAVRVSGLLRRQGATHGHGLTAEDLAGG